MPTPLKIAFTSCAEATQFPRPPVWTRIADAWPAPWCRTSSRGTSALRAA